MYRSTHNLVLFVLLSSSESDVTVCVATSSFIQVTVSPTLMLIGFGSNALSPTSEASSTIDTLFLEVVVDDVVLVCIFVLFVRPPVVSVLAVVAVWLVAVALSTLLTASALD